jgi:hypothetical protein
MQEGDNNRTNRILWLFSSNSSCPDMGLEVGCSSSKILIRVMEMEFSQVMQIGRDLVELVIIQQLLQDQELFILLEDLIKMIILLKI